MPIYDYLCPVHGKVSDVWAPMNQSKKPCPTCGRKMHRLVTSFNVRTDITPYYDENLGQSPVYVKSRQHRKKLMNEKGLVEAG